MNNTSDEQLISDFLKGDYASLEILINRYLKSVYNFIFHLINNQQQAEDLTQETFIKVWKNLKKFNLNKNFKAWVYTLGRHV